MFDSEACSQTSNCPVLDDPKASHSPEGLTATSEIGDEAIDKVCIFEKEGNSYREKSPLSKHTVKRLVLG